MKTALPNKTIAPLALFCTLLASGCAYSTGENTALPQGLQSITSAKGNVLADKNGMTLYTFDKDKPMHSNCYNGCAAKWPPLIASTDVKSTEFSTSTRSDGQLQLNYQGKPLYLWVGDKHSGDITGDGVKGVWHLVNY